MGLVVQTAEEMERCLNAVREASVLVYDVETSGLNPRKNHIVGYVLTVNPSPDGTFYVPVRHGGGGNCLDWKGLDEAECLTPLPLHPFEIELAKIAERPDLRVIGHNLVFDLLFSFKKGIKFAGRVECTQVAMALINEWLPSFSLDSCAKYMGVTQKLGQDLYFHLADLFKDPKLEADKKQMQHYWRLSGIDSIGTDYAMGDGVSTWELREAQQLKLDEDELGQVWDVECRVTKTLARMQNYGMRIGPDNLEIAIATCEEKIGVAKQALPAGLNVNSPIQLKALFDKEGVTGYAITEKGNASFTEEYLSTNELGKKIIAVRKISKLITSFINPVIETHMHDGRIFPSYAQVGEDEFGTVIGRLSSYQPNIQQVPKRNKELGQIFRKIFVPDPDMEWGSNDYSQCEPRLYAEYSQSASMIKGYTSDPVVDFYQLLSNITGKPRSPTAGIAGNCKQLALSIFYGAGNSKTAEMLGTTLAEATDLRTMVKRMVPEIEYFTKNASSRANERGWVKTALGRRSRFPNMTTNRFSGKPEREFSYKAGGRVIAGTNADLIKLAIVNVDDYLISMGCPPPLATIHDSIEVQFPKGRNDINLEVARIMEATAREEPMSLELPQIVDNGTGKDWSEATYGQE